MSEILDPKNLRAFVEKIQHQRQQLVLTNGCFDLLHIGHIRYLQAARKLGDVLLVAINSDASVRALKGDGRPINCQDDRAEIIAALKCVDYVTIFHSLRVTPLIREIHPSIYVKGGDYTLETLDLEERTALKEAGTKIHLLPHVPNRSTTKLIHQLSPSVEPGC